MSVELDDVDRAERSRERRTRRWLVAGLVVACVAGPLAGFAIGRAATDDPAPEVAAGAGTGTGGDRSVAALTAPGSPGAPGESLEHLFTRTTAEGVVIRVYRTPMPVAAATDLSCGVVRPVPSILGELSTDAAVTTAFGAAAADPGAGDDRIATGDWGTFGIAEQAPARWVIASVGANVTRARATFAGGATDDMEPVDGIVALASPVGDVSGTGRLEALDGDAVVDQLDLTPGGGSSASASAASGTASSSAESSVQLHASTSDGTGSSSAASSSASSASSSGSASSSSGSVSTPTSVVPAPSPDVDWDRIALLTTRGEVPCPPLPGVPVPVPTPATLPAPGEPPADPDGARAEIEQAYAISYDGTKSPEEKAGYQEAPTGITPEQLAASGFEDQAADASAKVTDVVFTSPTTAAVRYDIAVANWPNQFPGRIGQAVLLDGRWRVARATLCNDLSLASLSCPPK